MFICPEIIWIKVISIYLWNLLTIDVDNFHYPTRLVSCRRTLNLHTSHFSHAVNYSHEYVTFRYVWNILAWQQWPWSWVLGGALYNNTTRLHRAGVYAQNVRHCKEVNLLINHQMVCVCVCVCVCVHVLACVCLYVYVTSRCSSERAILSLSEVNYITSQSTLWRSCQDGAFELTFTRLQTVLLWASGIKPFSEFLTALSQRHQAAYLYTVIIAVINIYIIIW